VLHILDSLRYSDRGTKEANQLQNILLQYFDGGKFKAGRISINVPQVINPFAIDLLINIRNQVPQQNNSKDCACYTIYFAQKFLLNPKATMPVIKVGGLYFLVLHISTDNAYSRIRLPLQKDWLNGG
jgi:Ulp1 family protease catalytic subunit